jgi:carboxypeptidase family protein
VLLHAPAVLAQTIGTTTGAVDGRVLDATEAVLTGVVVTVAGVPLLVPFTTESARDGSYRFPTLPPGRYTLTFALPGFETERREGILVSLGVTTTVNLALRPANQQEVVSVEGGAALVDRRSATISTTFDAGELDRLPGSRTLGAILAATPALQLQRFDVGGSTAFAPGMWSAYGENATITMIEGIFATFVSSPPGLFLDYGSVADASVGSGASGPEVPLPGIVLRFVTKSGGNRYAGMFYAGYENRAWQGHNIDAKQEERGAPVADGLPARDANRLLRYHDVNGDIGGYIWKGRLWWYGSARDHGSSARQVSFEAPIDIRVTSLTGKATWRVRDGHHIVGFAQGGRNRQPIRLDGFLRPATARNTSVESTLDQLATGLVWKTEWNAVVGRAMYVEARVGQSGVSRAERPNGSSPRTEDLLRPEVSGGNRDWQDDHRNNQADGSITYFREGWGGRHELTPGVQLLRRTVAESWLHAYGGDDVLHVTENGRPAQVYLFQTPSRSESGYWSYAGYASDSWRVHNRVTINLAVRFERFRVFLPPQERPVGRFNPTRRSFDAVPTVADWNTVAPRIGAIVDLRGDGRTVLKASYGHYWLPPGTDLGFNVNPNGRVWWQRFKWADANGDRLWQPGEEFDLPLTPAGASIDPNLKLGYLRVTTVRFEQEAVAGLFVGTGLVWRGARQQGARQRASWPFESFSVPVTKRDDGPDAELGTPDDGADIGLFELRPDLLGQSAFVVRNASYADSETLTWEVVARRRFSRRWSVFASFAHMWNRDHASGYLGQPVRANVFPATPNDLINTDGRGRHVYRDWSFKAHGTYAGPRGLLITPFIRHQSGQPFGRTLVARLNYDTIRVLAEPVGTRRQRHVTLVDVRIEKMIRLGDRRLTAFVDVFNALNANPEQNVRWETGATFLQPLVIVPPRIARVGFRLDW